MYTTLRTALYTPQIARPVAYSTTAVSTLSVRDIPYYMAPNTSYHPVNVNSAIRRITEDFFTKARDAMKVYPVTLELLLSTVLSSNKAKSVWAIVFEYRGQPFYIVRNLAHTNTTLPYRRVLVVKLDAFVISNPVRTWSRVYSNLMTAESYPSISTMNAQ